jgi:hypothetical protein
VSVFEGRPARTLAGTPVAAAGQLAGDGDGGDLAVVLLLDRRVVVVIRAAQMRCVLGGGQRWSSLSRETQPTCCGHPAIWDAWLWTVDALLERWHPVSPVALLELGEHPVVTGDLTSTGLRSTVARHDEAVRS